MRAIFNSKFPNSLEIQSIAYGNVEMISSGKELYIDFFNRMSILNSLDDDKYLSIPDIYDIMGIKPFCSRSKRSMYSYYNSGVVVGAGSGNDCIDLISDKKWMLFDLTDENMDNRAIGYCESKASFNMTGTRDGDTLTHVDEKYKKGEKEIDVIRIDKIDFSEYGVGIISMDVEGSALDVLAGATNTIKDYGPDLLVSIYHNWIEYLLVIPFLYDLGYEIEVITTANMLPSQPHLELSLLCRMKS